MVTTKEAKVMHPDVYDTLEFGSLVFGGIGAAKDFPADFSTFETRYDFNCPICVWGYAALSEEDMVREIDEYYTPDNPIGKELVRLGIRRSQNDGAVARINERRQRKLDPFEQDIDKRVPFRMWAKELGVVRGDAADFPEPTGVFSLDLESTYEEE